MAAPYRNGQNFWRQVLYGIRLLPSAPVIPEGAWLATRDRGQVPAFATIPDNASGISGMTL